MKMCTGGGGDIHRYGNLLHVQEPEIKMKKNILCVTTADFR